MKVIYGLSAMRKRKRPLVLAAGFFDGLHIGHQRLITHAIEEGRTRCGAWVMTFDDHPMKVLDPEKAPPLLTSTAHKLALLKDLGVYGCILVPFTRTLARLEPDSFIELLKKNIPALQLLLVGRNWTFGRGARGTTAILKSLAHDFKVRVIPPVCWRGKPISSTRIRRCISSGNLREASRMLGRPVSIWGTVVRGNRLGTSLGVPTANITPHNEARPPDGVYAAKAVIDRRSYPGVVNLGTRPTLNAGRLQKLKGRVLELHVLDFDRPLYRKRIEVVFLDRLRDERRFLSVEALKKQIAKDIRRARQLPAFSGQKKDPLNTLQIPASRL